MFLRRLYCLPQAKRATMQAIWCKACAEQEHNAREGHRRSFGFLDEEPSTDLAEDMQLCSQFSPVVHDKRWFFDTFCSGNMSEELSEQDSIWAHVTRLHAPIDILAVLACVTELRECFLSRQTVTVEASLKTSHGPTPNGGVEHLIISGAFADQLGKFLNGTLPTGLSRSSGNTAPPLVVITDAGQDLDDEMAMVLMRSLQDKGLVDFKGAVATLAPSRARARLVRGTLNQLGLEHIPVGIGSHGGFTGYSAIFEETARPYIISDDDKTFDTTSGIDLLKQLYDDASDTSVELLCM